MLWGQVRWYFWQGGGGVRLECGYIPLFEIADDKSSRESGYGARNIGDHYCWIGRVY